MNNEPVAWLWTKDGKPQSALLNEPMTVPSDPYWKDKGFKAIPLYTRPVKALTNEDRVKVIGTLKWAGDLLREAGHDEAVDEVQDCIMLLRKAQEK